jgi:TonB family protein
VTDARVVSSTGPESLRRAALSSVLQWHFSTEAVEIAPGDRRPTPSNFEITIGFHPTQAPKPATAEPAASASAPNWTVGKIDLSRVSDELRSKVEEAITVREGQSIRPDDIEQQRANVRKVDSHLTLAAGWQSTLAPGGRAQEPSKMMLTVLVRTPPVSMEGMVPAPSGSVSPERIKVGGNVAALNLIEKITPLYPPDAKLARIQGAVKFQAVIGKDGRIQDLQLISGHPLLAQSAQDAVRQWVYKPTLLNGNPVEVITQIDVNYTLAP